MRNAKNITKNSCVRAPWTIVVIMRRLSRSHRTGPVLPSSLSMDVPITTTVITLRNFLMSAVLPVANVTCSVAVKVCAMKVRHASLVAHQAGVYLSFCSIKWVGVLILSLGGMLVVGYPSIKFTGTRLFTFVWHTNVCHS